MRRVRRINAKPGSTFGCTQCDRRTINALRVNVVDVWHKCPTDSPVQRKLRRMHLVTS